MENARMKSEFIQRGLFDYYKDTSKSLSDMIVKAESKGYNGRGCDELFGVVKRLSDFFDTVLAADAMDDDISDVMNDEAL